MALGIRAQGGPGRLCHRSSEGSALLAADPRTDPRLLPGGRGSSLPLCRALLPLPRPPALRRSMLPMWRLWCPPCPGSSGALTLQPLPGTRRQGQERRKGLGPGAPRPRALWVPQSHTATSRTSRERWRAGRPGHAGAQPHVCFMQDVKPGRTKASQKPGSGQRDSICAVFPARGRDGPCSQGCEVEEDSRRVLKHRAAFIDPGPQCPGLRVSSLLLPCVLSWSAAARPVQGWGLGASDLAPSRRKGPPTVLVSVLRKTPSWVTCPPRGGGRGWAGEGPGRAGVGVVGPPHSRAAKACPWGPHPNLHLSQHLSAKARWLHVSCRGRPAARWGPDPLDMWLTERGYFFLLGA